MSADASVSTASSCPMTCSLSTLDSLTRRSFSSWPMLSTGMPVHADTMFSMSAMSTTGRELPLEAGPDSSSLCTGRMSKSEWGLLQHHSTGGGE